MKQNFLFLLAFLCLFIACKPATEQSTTASTDAKALSTENTTAVDNSINNPKLKVKNKTEYHEDFLMKLEEIAHEMNNTIELDGNIAIIEGEKVILSPIDKIGSIRTLKGGNKNFNVELAIKAENYTTWQYTATITANGKSNTSAKQVYLSPHFFLGAESLENPADGISFLATKFSHEENDCYAEITLGSTEGSSKLSGIFISTCNGKLGELNGENTPFLSE